MAIFIFPPAYDWEEAPLRVTNLTRQFAEHGHQVYYCNLGQKADAELGNSVSNLHFIDNADLFFEGELQDIRTGKPLIAWCLSVINGGLLEKVRPDLTVYDCSEINSSVDEQDMVQVSELILCASDLILNHFIYHYPGKKAFLIPDGFDLETEPSSDQLKGFRTYIGPVSEDTEGLIIGCPVLIDHRIDMDLVEKICQARPHDQIIFFTDVDGPGTIGHSKAVVLKVNEETKNKYLSFIDIYIFPYKTGNEVQGFHPGEVYGCLTSGKPVISTFIPDLASMNPLVDTARDHEEFVAILSAQTDAPAANEKEKKAFGAANSWKSRSEYIQQLLTRELPDFGAETKFMWIYSSADLTVNNVYKGINLDSDPVFIGRIENSVYRYLLSFSLEKVPPGIKKAILAIYIDRCDHREKSRTIDALPVTEPWDEHTGTWQGKPSASLGYMASKTFHYKKGWLEWDVTAIVRKWINQTFDNAGFMIKERREQEQSLIRGINRHKETYYSPRLKLYY